MGASVQYTVHNMNETILQNLRIVLVGTTHPGNIGAAARAMKTMRLSQLYLVDPKIYPSAEATSRAAGADDVLANAIVTKTLAEALINTQTVYATTARSRSISWPVFTPREAVVDIVPMLENQQVALVFGRENSGLTNEEVGQANRIIHIPTNPDYSSLNLASAVQLLAYEVLTESLKDVEAENKSQEITEFMSHEQMEQFYTHLEETMLQSEFLRPDQPGKLMQRMRRLFGRAVLQEDEYNILRGFMKSMNEKISEKS